MKALSIRQPWAWAILEGGKRIENRSWKAPPRAMIGQRFLIHAAKGMTCAELEDAASWMERQGLIRTQKLGGSIEGTNFAAPILHSVECLPRGAIVGAATLAEAVFTTDLHHRVTHGTTGPCLLCDEQPVAYMGRRVFRDGCRKRDPWAIPGAMGLILADVVALAEPVPLKGMLGFFDVPILPTGSAAEIAGAQRQEAFAGLEVDAP